MKELNPRDNNKIQKIYEDMLKENFKRKVKKATRQTVEVIKRIKESPWNKIQENKYL